MLKGSTNSVVLSGFYLNKVLTLYRDLTYRSLFSKINFMGFRSIFNLLIRRDIILNYKKINNFYDNIFEASVGTKIINYNYLTNYPVLNLYNDMIRFNVLRLFLIKSNKGKSHLVGKPVRGQRSWSNAKNSYYCNRVLRTYINKKNKLKI